MNIKYLLLASGLFFLALDASQVNNTVQNFDGITSMGPEYPEHEGKAIDAAYDHFLAEEDVENANKLLKASRDPNLTPEHKEWLTNIMEVYAQKMEDHAANTKMQIHKANSRQYYAKWIRSLREGAKELNKTPKPKGKNLGSIFNDLDD